MITKENITELDNAVDIICKYCDGGICSCCPNKTILQGAIEKYNTKYLLCELDDENYTEPRIIQFNSYESAYEKALIDCGHCFEDDYTISYYQKGRFDVCSNNKFFVAEIKKFDSSKGDHILVWHHAYNGVDFNVLMVGTYAECLERKRKEIKRIFDEYDLSGADNENFDTERDTCIDTGEEWEMFNIILID